MSGISHKLSMRILALLIATCCVLHADVMSDLKKTLGGLNGGEPVKALVSYEFSTRTGDDDKPVVEEAKITASLADGPEGLTINWPRELIDAAAKEASGASEGAAKKPAIRGAMDNLNATTLNDYLNSAPRLLRALEQAELLSDKTEPWESQPTRVLMFNIPQKLPKYVKELQCTVKVWLGTDGVPLAAESRVQVKGRALLVISFEAAESEDWRFTRTGQRLVATRHTKESRNSGGGEKGVRKTAATLNLVDR